MENNDFNKGNRQSKKKGCSKCGTSRETGRRVSDMMQVGASQAAILRVIQHGQAIMALEEQLRVARKDAQKSFKKDHLAARSDNV